MAQVKIFGLEESLAGARDQMSYVIHSCVVDALDLPPEKKFHRFFPMKPANFIYPEGRSESYTIIEIQVFEGRSVESKKKLIRLLYDRLKEKLGMSPKDLEINIIETPMSNWGIKGLPADELSLDYKVDV